MRVKIHSHFRGKEWDGEVPIHNLEDVFRFFNRVDDEDCDRLTALGYDLPSLSVGDLAWIEGFAFSCESVGWERREDLDLDTSVPSVF